MNTDSFDDSGRLVWVCMVLAGLLGGAVFVGLLGYRTDYAGHFLAGYGGTLGLLALLLAVRDRPLGWDAVGVTVVAILLGVGTEATVFKLAIFDPVDFCNQSLGAVLAGACVTGRRGSLARATSAAALALVFLGLGGVLAFA